MTENAELEHDGFSPGTVDFPVLLFGPSFTRHAFFITHERTGGSLMQRQVKVKVMSICIAPIHETSLRRSGIARTVKGCQNFTCTSCVSPASGMSHTCLCLPSAAGTHLPTPEGWKAEYTLVRSSPGRDSNRQPPDYKSSTLPTTQPSLAHHIKMYNQSSTIYRQ